MTFSGKFEEVHALAAAATGLSDFGDQSYVEPMRLMLSDYESCRFSPLGVDMAVGTLVNLLVGRLCAQQGLRDQSAADDTGLDRPIIILGMSRTGSTALHRLLAKDPANQWLAPWLGNFPMPRPARCSWPDSPYFRRFEAGLEALYAASPEIRQMHPMAADEPEECRMAIDHSFWSLSTASIATMPQYGRWVLDHEPRDAFLRHRKLLSLIANGDRRRWVLKDPTTYTVAPETLLATFPNACFVVTHRDPTTAMASVASLGWSLRRMLEPELTQVMHGRYHLHLWRSIPERMEAARRANPAITFLDVHIKDLQHDPVATATKIYEHFDIPVSDAALDAWRASTGSNPRSGHGDHSYSAEEFGLSKHELDDLIPGYMERYRELYPDY